jgi:hypothetical protein
VISIQWWRQPFAAHGVAGHNGEPPMKLPKDDNNQRFQWMGALQDALKILILILQTIRLFWDFK